MPAKSYGEHIADLEATRKEKSDRMKAIHQKAMDEGRTMDTAENEEFDTLEGEIKDLDADLARTRRLKAIEDEDKKTAKPVDDQVRQRQTTAVRPGVPAVPKGSTKELPKGTRFTRLAMALAAGRGSVGDAIRFAKNWDSSTPDVAQFIERAVAGTTTGVSWASPLVDETNLIGEFIELLRPETLMGKLQGFRRVPFNVAIPSQTGGSTVGWVGEGAVKPVSELEFGTVTLGHNKVAGIVVITEELARFSSPDAEETVRRDLIEQTAQFLDDAFINPDHTASAGVRPASVTNGATAIPASGTDGEAFLCDLAALQEAFLTANMSVGGTYLVMSSVQAARLALFRNALGQYEFPNITAAGGSIAGIPVVTSENVPTDSSGSIIALVKPSEILLADDGSVTLDASREATLDMVGGNTPNFSLWQRNCVGIRAERYITWKPRRAAAVAYISGAAYTPCASSP